MVLLHVTYFLLLTYFVAGQLSYLDPSISQGPCSYPPTVTIPNLAIFSPVTEFYVPFASRAMYRFQYTMLKNGTYPQTEADVASLQPRALNWDLGGLLLLPPIFEKTVYAFGSQAYNFSYDLTPSSSNGFLPPQSSPFLNFTGNTLHGSPGSGPDGFGGDMVFTIVANDATSWVIWACIGGEQGFHILSFNQTLTINQVNTYTTFLQGHGFAINDNTTQYMTYTD